MLFFSNSLQCITSMVKLWCLVLHKFIFQWLIFTFQVTCTADDDAEVASTDRGTPLGTVMESKTLTVDIVNHVKTVHVFQYMYMYLHKTQEVYMVIIFFKFLMQISYMTCIV